MDLCKIFYFILVLGCIGVSATPPKLVDSYYTLKEAELLGATLDVATYYYTFDQELYFASTHICELNDACTNRTLDACVCDYTNSTGVCGSGSTRSTPGCCTEDYCDKSKYDWIDLEENTASFSALLEGDYSQFRFFLEDVCDKEIFVSIEILYGNAWVTTNNSGPVTAENIGRDNYQSNRFSRICPADSRSTPGTFFASVQAISDSAFYITWTVIDIPATPSLSPTTTCNNDYSSTHTCLGNNEVVGGICPEDETLYLYTYSFTGCQQITALLTVYGFGTDADLYGSFDTTNVQPYFGEADFSSYLPNNDYLTLSVCAEEGKTETLFFTVDCWQAGSDYSNYTFVVTGTDTSSWTYTPLTEVPPYKVFDQLVGASRLQTPATNDTVQFSNWILCDSVSYTCTETWMVPPAKDSNIFWPVPPAVNGLGLSALKSVSADWNVDSIYPTEYLKNTYMISLLVGYSINGVPTTIVDSSILDKMEIVFLAKVTNSLGEPISGTFTAPQRSIGCNYTAFVPLQNQINSLIQDIENVVQPEEINGIRFQFDLVKFTDEYFGCQNLLERMVTSSTVQEDVMTTGCYSTPGTDEYENDPCCSNVASWSTTCVPRSQTISKAASQANTELSSQLCKHSTCIDSYLDDYAQVVDQYDQCSASVQADDTAETYAVYNSWRSCKEYVYDMVCYNDTDCSLPWGQYECNVIDHICNVPRVTQEEEFAKCLIADMDKYVELYIKSSLGLTVSKSDPSYLSSFIAALQTPDCVQLNGTGLNLNARSRYQLKLFDETCAQTHGCPSPSICEDRTCLLEEDFCTTWCRIKVFSPIGSDEASCTEDVVCNWNSDLCVNKTKSECESLCDNTNFCGYCKDNKHCMELPVSLGSCNSENVCILPNGSAIVGLDEAVCSSYGQCTEKCPLRCESAIYSEGMCYSNLAGASCTTDGGSIDSITGLCIYSVANESDCSYNWFTCTDLDLTTCSDCANGESCSQSAALAAQCFVNDQVECQTQVECEAQGGICSDRSDLFQSGVFGACVVGRTPPTGNFAGYSLYPLCIPGQGDTFPNGCVDHSLNKSACADAAGVWWEPSISQSQCTNVTGCLDIRDEVYPVGLQFAFSPKDKQNCESSYNPGGTWTSYFSWTQGKWIRGVLKPLSVVQRQVNTENDWAPAFDYNKLQKLFFEGATIRSASGSKSEALCQTTRAAQTLTSVACDCSDVTGTECFSDSKSTVIAQARICEGIASELLTPDANLYFANTSVVADCTDVLLSSVAASNFKTTDSVKLSGDFASFKDAEDYAVKNDNGAIIGDIVGDGTMLNPATTVNEFILCLETRALSSNHDNHPVADFATASEDLSTLTPQEMNVYQNGSALCAIVSVSKQVTYFPINRLADWKNVSYRLFDTTALGLIYTLAALFTVVSLVAGIRLVFVLKELVMRVTALKQEHIVVIFIFMFNFVRMVYFYLLPSGSVQTPVSDYVLVVLPTFFFFTAFTAIIVIWMALSSGKLSSDREAFTRLVNRTALTLNIILYLFFIFIVLLFNFTVNLSKGDCPGRVQSSLDKQVKIQSIISIVYSVVIAVISLVMSAAFVFFGYRLIKMMHAGMRYRKLSLATAVAGGGFLLHCVFVITVSSLSRPNIIFSFIGLIITELLPSLFILLLFLPQRATKFKQFASSNQGNSSQMETTGSVSNYKSTSLKEVGTSSSSSPNV